MRIEPAPSQAEAIGTRPAATAAARAAARAARGALRVPGIAGDAVGRRLGEAADRQLRQQRLADDDRARLAQPPHHLGVGRWPGSGKPSVPWVVTSPARSTSSLIAIGTPEQRPLLAGLQPRFGLLGFEQRPLGEDHAEGVQLRVEPLDPLQVQPHQLGRRDLPRPHHLRLARRAGEGDVVDRRRPMVDGRFHGARS